MGLCDEKSGGNVGLIGVFSSRQNISNEIIDKEKTRLSPRVIKGFGMREQILKKKTPVGMQTLTRFRFVQGTCQELVNAVAAERVTWIVSRINALRIAA